MKKSIFTKIELQKLSETIAEAEKKTSGEILPLIVQRSSSYHGITASFCIVGALVASFIFARFFAHSQWDFPILEMFLLQMIGISTGYSFSRLNFLKRFFLPKKLTARRVHEAALANFVACGLTETKDRTGILIYVSVLEHKIEILADKGINEKVPVNYWNDQIQILAHGLKTKNAFPAFQQVILEIGDKLQKNFPVSAHDTNEIPNTVLEKPGF